jgi:hypothetical protein
VRERDTGHVGTADFRQIKPEPTPADVEHALIGRQKQFGGQVPLLGQLRVVERLRRPRRRNRQL